MGKYGIVWGRAKALAKSQQLALKRSAGLRLRDSSQEAKLSFYSVISDEYRYDECTQDKLFFCLCVDMLINKYSIQIKDETELDSEEGISFEGYLSRLYNSDVATETVKRDITALCSEKYAVNGRLQKHMMQFIRRMAREEEIGNINTKKLERDILAWDDPTHRVQMEWGQSIARVWMDDKDSKNK